MNDKEQKLINERFKIYNTKRQAEFYDDDDEYVLIRLIEDGYGYSSISINKNEYELYKNSNYIIYDNLKKEPFAFTGEENSLNNKLIDIINEEDTKENLASIINAFMYNYDTYEYNNRVDTKEEGYNETLNLLNEKPEEILRTLNEIKENEKAEENIDVEFLGRIEGLIDKVKKVCNKFEKSIDKNVELVSDTEKMQRVDKYIELLIPFIENYNLYSNFSLKLLLNKDTIKDELYKYYKEDEVIFLGIIADLHNADKLKNITKKEKELLNDIQNAFNDIDKKDTIYNLDDTFDKLNILVEDIEKEKLSRYMDLLKNHYAKIDDNKFYEEINKMTKDEQKELITIAYKHNNNVDVQELINVMEVVLQQQGISVSNLKERYDPDLYKVYDFNDNDKLLYIGFDYKKANEIASQKMKENYINNKVFVDKVDKNLIFHMEKLVDEYYKAGNIPLHELHDNIQKSFEGVYTNPKYKTARDFAIEWFSEYDKYKNGYSDYNYERLYRGNLIYDKLLEKFNNYTHGIKAEKEKLEKALECKTWKQKINFLQNSIARFEPSETNLTNKNTLKL